MEDDQTLTPDESREVAQHATREVGQRIGVARRSELQRIEIVVGSFVDGADLQPYFVTFAQGIGIAAVVHGPLGRAGEEL